MNITDKSKARRNLTIKKNLLKMIEKRGYELGNEEDVLSIHDEHVYAKFMDNLASSYEREHGEPYPQYYNFYINNNCEPPQLLLAIFGYQDASNTQKIGKDFIEKIINIYEQYSALCAEIIIIIDAPLSPKAEGTLSYITDVKWQVFKEEDIIYVPIEYIYYSKHELVPKSEVKELLRTLGVTKNKLPLIYDTDPIVKYYNWDAGEIVRIYRDDSSINVLTPESVQYRLIVKCNK